MDGTRLIGIYRLDRKKEFQPEEIVQSNEALPTTTPTTTNAETAPNQAVVSTEPANSDNGSEINKIVITSKNSSNDKLNNSSRFFKTGRLQKFLDKIKGLFEKDDIWSKIFIFVLIYILGVLHALESGLFTAALYVIIKQLV